LLATLLRQLHESSQKVAYDTFLHQSKYINDGIDAGLEELQLIFEQIPKFHHNNFMDLMQQVSDYIVEYENIPEQKLDTNKENIINAYSNLQVPQDIILHVHNPISDGYCGFRELYGNILGYDINHLMAVLSYLEPMCPMEFWFYSLKCAQLASDAFNKSDRRRKPVILQCYEHNHIVLVQLKPNKKVQLPPLNPQYVPICDR
ncbi:9024_t:CDS:2, partial [Cetraspora pellucida]